MYERSWGTRRQANSHTSRSTLVYGRSDRSFMVGAARVTDCLMHGAGCSSKIGRKKTPARQTDFSLDYILKTAANQCSASPNASGKETI